MTEPIAYLNGQYLPLSETKVSVFDLGLVLGASVTEMIRTFGHRPFRLDDHLDRLARSLNSVGFPTDVPTGDLPEIVSKVVDHNAKLIPPEHDLGIVLFVTAGQNLTYFGATGREQARQGSVCCHTFPLPYELWADKLATGQHLVTPAVRHLPPDTVDPKIKARSRLHWYLADQQARLVDPQAIALLLDHHGSVTETSTANFFIVEGRRIRMPGAGSALGGVSQQVVVELAAKLGIECVADDVRPHDVFNADEAFTSSTPYCLLPATRFNGRPIGTGTPGPVFQQLLSAWNQLAGLDIIDQIRQGAADRSAENP